MKDIPNDRISKILIESRQSIDDLHKQPVEVILENLRKTVQEKYNLSYDDSLNLVIGLVCKIMPWYRPKTIRAKVLAIRAAQ